MVVRMAGQERARKAAGKPVGCFGGNREDNARWAAAGATLLTLGDDAQFVRNGMAAVARQLGMSGSGVAPRNGLR